MPVRTAAIIDYKALDNLDNFVAAFPGLVDDIVSDIHRQYKAEFLSELGAYPGKVKYPIEWTSEKQRRAFFATNGFGHGIPYRRTNKLKNSWKFFIVRTSEGVEMVVSNNVYYAKYVVGGVRDSGDSLKPIQQFHRNTGWLPVRNTINFWQKAFTDEFTRRFTRAIT